MLKKIFLLLSRDASVTVINFVILIILARYLSLPELAVWFSVQTIFLVLDGFCRFKSEIPFVVLYSTGKKSLLKSSQLIIVAISSTLLILIYLLFREYIIDITSTLITYKINHELDVIFLSFILSISGTSYLYYLTALRRYSLYNILLLLQSLINLIFILVALKFLDNAIYAPILGQFFSWLFIFVVAIFSFRVSKFSFDSSQVITLIRSGISFYLNSLFAMLQQQAGRFYCILFLPVNDLAYFGQIQGLVSLLIKVPAAMNTIILPEFSGGNKNNKVTTILLYFTFAQILITSILYVTSFDLIYLLFGDKFLPIIKYFQFLLPFVSVYTISLVLIGFQNSKKDFVSMNIIVLTSLIVQLAYILLNDLTFTNLINSMAVSYIIFLFTTIFYSRKFLR